MNRFALCCLVASALLTGCKKDVSGSYLADDRVAVCWLQLVRTPDDHLTGQIVSSVLKPDGKIDHGSVSLAGAVNGENITLTGGASLGWRPQPFRGHLTATRLRSQACSQRRSY
jgi:hypothetical protein